MVRSAVLLKSRLRSHLMALCLAAAFMGSIPCFARESAATIAAAERAEVSPLRFEVMPLDRDAEIITFFFTYNTNDDAHNAPTETPLISVLRDTLGSESPAAHRLRYVWIHTYAQPSVRQRLGASIPFFYNRIGNAQLAEDRRPAPAIEFGRTHLLKRVSALVFRALLADPRVFPFEAALHTYRENAADYRQTQMRRVTTILDMEDVHAGAPLFLHAERRQLQRRLMETERPIAGFLNEPQLERLYLKEMIAMRQACARNWELLRQRTEAEDLYFEPLLLPDGTATHAMVFVAKEDLEKNRNAPFNDRFLSIGKPWGDPALLNWTGAIETRYFDTENRRVEAGASGSKEVEFIPLALYGLDHPEVPAILIDFRKPLNAKRRELSRDASEQIEAKLSRGPGLLNRLVDTGKTVVKFIARRRGADLFRESRGDSYSRLKMLLSIDHGFSGPLMAEITRRIEHVARNPLENDFASETQLARAQYLSLLAYAGRPDGLQAQLDRDRRAELMSASHGGAVRTLFRIAEIASLGVYTHREKPHRDMNSILEARRLSVSHQAFLRDVLKSGSPIEVGWDMAKVRESLGYIASDASLSDRTISRKIVQIFRDTNDEETRQFCLATLYRLDTRDGRNELMRIAQDRNVDSRWRDISAAYLNALPGTLTDVSPVWRVSAPASIEQ